jgi:hypothetical protein
VAFQCGCGQKCAYERFEAATGTKSIVEGLCSENFQSTDGGEAKECLRPVPQRPHFFSATPRCRMIPLAERRASRAYRLVSQGVSSTWGMLLMQNAVTHLAATVPCSHGLQLILFTTGSSFALPMANDPTTCGLGEASTPLQRPIS